MVAEHWPVTADLYHADRTAISHSVLECFAESSELYQGRYLRNIWPMAQTPEMRFGSVFHGLCLEFRRPAVEPKCDRRTKPGKIAYASFLNDVGDKEIVSSDEWDLLLDMGAAVERNQAAKAIITDPGPTEFSVKWTDAETGIPCKLRADKLLEKAPVVADLKTCRAVNAKDFSAMAYRLGYHRQASWYLDGLAEFAPEDSKSFVFVCVQKSPPFTCAVFELDEAFIELGRSENRELLRRFAECKATGDWTAPTNGKIITLAAPRWAFNDATEWSVA